MIRRTWQTSRWFSLPYLMVGKFMRRQGRKARHVGERVAAGGGAGVRGLPARHCCKMPQIMAPGVGRSCRSSSSSMLAVRLGLAVVTLQQLQ